MQIKSLQLFCDIIDQRSFSRAAEANGISQSGASQMLLHLEGELGVKLIDRSKRPFVLTNAGQIYYEGCRRLMRRYMALEEETRSVNANVSGRVSVAAIYSVGLSHMSHLVKDFMRQHPKANLSLQYEHPARVYELVRHGMIDLGLVGHPFESRSTHTISWRVEPLVLVCAPHHPLANEESIAWEQLNGMSFVAFDEDPRLRSEIDEQMAAQHVTVDVSMAFDNVETVKRAVEINAGISILPEPTVQSEVTSKTLVARPIEDLQLVRPLNILHRRNAELSTTAQRFIQLLRDTAPSAVVA
jgi:DNA-binding transcriptional LysR family regulator